MIYLRNIALHFGARTLFEGVNLAIRPGEKIGLIGKNGSGKSTLLKLLAGQMTPDNGAIEVPSETRIGLLAQTVELNQELTPIDICNQAFSEIMDIEAAILRIQEQLQTSVDVDEQIRLAGELSSLYERQALLGAEQRSGEVEKVLKGMGFTDKNFTNPLRTFSGGWQMRVELSRLLLTQPDLLLLDEPTNHLDIESILWFIQYLKEYVGTVIIVSHDQHFLDNVTQRTLEVELREIRDYPFPYHRAMQHKEEIAEIKEAAYENQQRLIAHKERLIDKFRAKASKARFAKALQTELDRMELVELDESDNRAIRLRFQQGIRSGKVVYKIENLSKGFGTKKVIEGLDLTIDRGMRIAFVGQNGQGKTTLAKMLAGVLTPDSGLLEKGINVQLGYYAQDQPDRIHGNKRVIDVIREAAPQETEGRLRSVLGGMLFSGEDVDKKCSVLSGGERARLAFACMLLSASNVLILDEPTNHLDIQSKEILKQALMSYEGTLIVVSHDLYFLEGLTNYTLEFADGRIKLHLYPIREFLEKRQVTDLKSLEFRSRTHTTDAPPPISDHPVTQKSRQDKRQVQKRLQSLEKSIEKLEAEKVALESDMADPGFYVSPDAAVKTGRYEKLTSELSEKMYEWESLVSDLDAE